MLRLLRDMFQKAERGVVVAVSVGNKTYEGQYHMPDQQTSARLLWIKRVASLFYPLTHTTALPSRSGGA